MADVDPKVLAIIEQELKKDPKISNADLQEKAKKINEEVGELSAQSFNARYPLRVKRMLSGKTGGRKKGSVKKPGAKEKTGQGRRGRQSAVQALLDRHLQEKRTALITALSDAQQRAVKSGSLEAVEKLGKELDRLTKRFGKF